MLEDGYNYKAISCEKIPELFLDKLVAKKHFGKFGKITRFILTPKRLSCTVEYENQEQAERAYMEAGNFNGIDFDVDYAENKVAHVQDTEQWVDPDVQAELDAMSPANRGFSGVSSGMRRDYGLTALARAANKHMSTAPLVKSAPTVVRSGETLVPPVPAAKPVPAAVRSELEAILRRPAFTDEDKYRVLDARDKLIRLKTVRQTDIKKAVAAKGTCPDMCPEKERLMREFQRQVSTFEMADEDEDSSSTISHRKAIKEYSRSSADQEVPLAHELRSESVLQMTMLYLMHRIMDLCDDPQTSLADWFHFVWDRTRSIRKDITQQELCSLGGVQLVEQCARFHIHCAARLVAEDPSVFDKKINAENLTKCLQTLKYMYHDLRIKGVQCPSEAEFRSYIILLNLGDSNFLWELKQLPESIQKSKQIKSAIAFYNALQNNNYVKFFSMIRSKETSYLMACILLGYFNRLRMRAMEVIIKSHNRGKIDVSLPLSYLSHVLGFDDEQSAINFITYHGLQCDEMDDRVFLDRMTSPSLEYAMDRALKLVESKRVVSVGECVCGQPLPSATLFELHQPHNSFDTNGLLRSDSWAADDQLRGDEVPAKPANSGAQDNGVFKTPEINVFKVPQISPHTSPKPQQREQQQEKSIFGSIASQEQVESRSSSPGGFKFSAIEKNEGRTSSPSGFKFGGNIFGGITTTSANNATASIFKPIEKSVDAASIFKPAQDVQPTTSIFKIPSSSMPLGSHSNSNIFQQNSIFNPSSEKPLSSAQTGNIFATNETKPSKVPSSSIFGNAAKETANIFQQNTQQLPTDTFRQDNVFQHFQTKPEMSIFEAHPSSASSQPLSAFKAPAVNTLKDMEQRRLQLEKEHELKQKQLEEEKRKLKELEEKRLREKQMQEEQKQREAARKLLEQLKQMCLKKSEEEKESMTNSIVEQEVAKIANEELQLYKTLDQASEMQRDLLLSEEIMALVEDVANEEYAIMCYDQMLLNRYFNRWLKHLRKKREQRKLMESTPIWVTTDSRAQFADALEHPCQIDNLEMIKRYRLGQPCDFKQLMQFGRHSSRDDQLKPLCLFNLVGRHLLAKRNFTPAGLLQQRHYFKFLISIPSDKEELPGFETYCNKWLFKHIKKAQLETGPFVHGLEHNLALCVRKLSGMYPKNEQGDEMKGEGDHSDGVVFLISGEHYPDQAKRRLYNLLCSSKNYKKLPVAIIAYNCLLDKEEIAEMLALNSLEDEGLLHSSRIFSNGISRKNFSLRKAIIDSIDYITVESYKENHNDIQAMAMENILGFLDASLGEEMWRRWQDSAKLNPVFHKICQQHEYVEGIYHKALQNLIQITQEDFAEMPEFPEELKEFVPQQQSATNIPLGLEFFPANWKDTTSKNIIYKFLQKLHLPSRNNNPPRPSVESMELWILNYASHCLPNEAVATKSAHEAIHNFINQLRDASLQTLRVEERLNVLNYLSILKPIIFAHINATLQQFHAQLKDAFVIYIRDDLKKYQTQPWWLNYQALDLVNMDYTEESESEDMVALDTSESKENEMTTQQLEEIMAKAQETSRRVEENILAIKQAKPLHKSSALSKQTLHLKRTLDESLYKFELSKKIGQYDTSYIDDLTDCIDIQIQDVLNESTQPQNGITKRQRLSRNDSEGTKTSEVDSVMARAMQLIAKVESMEDRKEKQKTSNRIQWGI